MLRGVAIIPGQFWAFSVSIAVLPGNIVCVYLLGRYVIQGVSSFGRSITGLFIVSSVIAAYELSSKAAHNADEKGVPKKYNRRTSE
jgi:hypothetical protein